MDAQIDIFGRTGYHDKFRAWYHVRDLPVSLGGTCSCPGGCVKNVPGTDFMVDGLQQVEVANGTAYDLPLSVPTSTTVTWQFTVRAYDIKFTAKFTPQALSSAPKVITSTTAKEAQSVTGTFDVTEPGIVTLTWDNTYSFMRSKIVAYKVDLVAPSTPSTDALATAPATSESGTLAAAQAAQLAEDMAQAKLAEA